MGLFASTLKEVKVSFSGRVGINARQCVKAHCRDLRNRVESDLARRNLGVVKAHFQDLHNRKPNVILHEGIWSLADRVSRTPVAKLFFYTIVGWRVAILLLIKDTVVRKGAMRP